MSDELHRDIGRHDEAIETLKSEVSAMRSDLAEIKAMMAQAKGGWRTLMAVAGVAGTMGAGIMKLLAQIKGGV